MRYWHQLGGRLTVLLYNFVPYDPTGGYGTTDPTPYDHKVRVDLTGLAPGTHPWSEQLVDGGHSGGIVAQGTLSPANPSLSVYVAGEGVALLTIR